MGNINNPKDRPVPEQLYCSDHPECRCFAASRLDVIRAVELHNNPRPVPCVREKENADE